MAFKRMKGAIAFSLAIPCLLFSETANDLAQKIESRSELANDYNLVAARMQNNQREYTILQAFCNSRLAEPARTARATYCTGKASEFNSRDADLKAQLQKLSGSVQQLDAQIRDLQKPAPPPTK